jgi:hypothetical protein
MPQPESPHIRPVRFLRIYCPVEPATFDALLAGRIEAVEDDPVARRILGVIRGANPLGDFGLYNGVVEISLGWESFKPAANARPARGTPGAVTLSPTIVLTTYFDAQTSDETLQPVLAQIMDVHPWEVPVIELGDTKLLVRGPAPTARSA